MNTKFAVLALAAAVASANAASTTPCPASELSKLASLAGSKNVFPCQAVSGGFNMIPPSGPPTADQRAKMCAASVCHDLIKEIIALNPTDCVLSLGNLNVYDLANTFEASCAASNPSPAPSVTPAPATTKPVTPGTPSTPAPATTKPVTPGAPAPTTVKPAC